MYWSISASTILITHYDTNGSEHYRSTVLLNLPCPYHRRTFVVVVAPSRHFPVGKLSSIIIRATHLNHLLFSSISTPPPIRQKHARLSKNLRVGRGLQLCKSQYTLSSASRLGSPAATYASIQPVTYCWLEGEVFMSRCSKLPT
jgi:hypothetical protein